MNEAKIVQFLNYTLFEFIKEYLLAIIIFISVFLTCRIVRYLITKKIKIVVDHIRIELGNLLIETFQSIGWFFYFIFSLWASLLVVSLPQIIKKLVFYLLLITVVYYITKGVKKIIEFYILKFKEEKKIDATLALLLNQISTVILWVISVLIILENLGINISALIAGLGIGGIAIAIALQNILTDIFAYFSIHFDKPFEIGDFIRIDDDVGEIKRIGIRSTRIKSLSGEELVVANKELTGKRIRNYKKMKERRIVFTFGVVYETPPEKLKKIPQIVREIFSSLEMARLDRVHFKSLGDFSLVFEVAYYVLTSNYLQYMNLQQKINLSLIERFKEEKIEFAYPSQTIFLKDFFKERKTN